MCLCPAYASVILIYILLQISRIFQLFETFLTRVYISSKVEHCRFYLSWSSSDNCPFATPFDGFLCVVQNSVILRAASLVISSGVVSTIRKKFGYQKH